MRDLGFRSASRSSTARSWAELRKVVWPTRNQPTSYTTAVIIFVVIMIGLVTLIDYGLGHAAKYVFG
ncbi:Protein translocase subunit SecE [Streptomyces griseomycini]